MEGVVDCNPCRVAIIQSRLAPFRVSFFERLGRNGGIELTVFTARYDAGGSRLKAGLNSSFQLRPLKTFSWAPGSCTFHPGLPWAILMGKFDVVVAEARLGLLLNPLVLALCRLMGKRFLWWTCGWERSEMEAISKLKRFARRILFPLAHGGIAYSRVAQRYLVSLGMRPERTWVAHNSLDTDSLLAIESELRKDGNFAAPVLAQFGAEGKLIVLFVGKLTRPKHVDLLLRAFDRVQQQRANAVLWIVGDGPDRARLEAIARETNNSAVRFLGEITAPHAINSLYMVADVFALPGTGGLALNQAMTFGKPVVVSSADGTEEDLVIDGQNGLYFEPNNSEDLARKILLLLDDSVRRAQMGRRSRDLILRSINMTNMVDSFRDAIFDRHPAPP